MRWFAALVSFVVAAVACVFLFGTDASTPPLPPTKFGAERAVDVSVSAPVVAADEGGAAALRVEADEWGGESAASARVPTTAGSLTVHVLMPSGARAADATVTLTAANADTRGLAEGRTVVTDPGGVAVFALPGGIDYCAVASCEGLVSARASPVGIGQTITLRLEPMATFSGRVVAAADEAAVADALLVLESEGISEYTTSQADGTFRFASRRLAPHRLEVLARGFERSRTIVMPAVTAQVLRLEAGRTLRGAVVTSTGAPIANARVEAVARRKVGESRLSLPLAEAFSDATGRFALDRLTEDGFDLVASCPLGRASLEIEDDPRGEVRLVVSPESSLRGVVSLSDGSPAARATIAVLDLGAFEVGSRRVKTDSAGRFAIEQIRADRSFRIVASAAGASPYVLDVASSQRDELRISLAEPNSLEGVVRTKDGTPVPDAVVELEAADEAVLRAARCARFTRSDATGTYRFRELPGGAMRVRAGIEGGASDFAVVSVAPGTTTIQDLVVDHLETLHGRVLDEHEVPLEGAQIRVVTFAKAPRDQAQPIARIARTAASGAFVVAGLAAGDVEVTVTAPGRGRFESVVTLPLAGELIVRLAPAPTLRGRVVAAANLAPVERFSLRVELVAEGDRTAVRKQSFQAPDGSFALDELPIGDLDLTVRADGFMSFGPVRVDSRATTPLEIRLDSAALLTGRIVNAAKTPTAGVRIFARCLDTAGTPRIVATHTGTDGRFRLRDLPFGRAEYGVGDETNPLLMLGDVELRSGERDVGDLAVPASASLAVVVAREWLTAGSRVVVRGVRTRSKLEAVMLDGQSSLGPLLPDRYVVEVDRPDAADPREEIELFDGAHGRVEMKAKDR